MRDWFEKSSWGMKQEEYPKDFFAILGVSENSTKREIRKGFNSIALKHHPDVSLDADSIRIFELAMNAYKTLKCEKSRIKYKAGLEFQRSLSQKKWNADSYKKSYKPPLQCGLVLADVRTIIGRLCVEKIHAWNSIKNDAGETLSVKWDRQSQSVVKTWI